MRAFLRELRLQFSALFNAFQSSVKLKFNFSNVFSLFASLLAAVVVFSLPSSAFAAVFAWTDVATAYGNVETAGKALPLIIWTIGSGITLAFVGINIVRRVGSAI